MCKSFKIILFVLLTIFVSCGITKNNGKKNISNKNEEIERGDYRVMFYNCENLFDIFDDTLKQDDEFLPEGAKYWSWSRYQEKLANISKVITGIGGWDPPEIIGLCEVENWYVLDGLVNTSAIKKHNYQIIHKESPDSRGIDVAFLYLKDKFTPITYVAIPVIFPEDLGGKATRDILYVKGYTNKKDTLHIFVNHWPSRWGGQMETEDKRMFVGTLLRGVVDSIFDENANSNIIIMGDLNDYPTDRSLVECLKAKTKYDNIVSNDLYSLSYYIHNKYNAWSHKYEGEGDILDQMIVSGALLNPENSINMTLDNAHIYDAEFLLAEDVNYVGYQPFRTYIGYKFNGGFSDHLPAYLDLFYKK